MSVSSEYERDMADHTPLHSFKSIYLQVIIQSTTIWLSLVEVGQHNEYSNEWRLCAYSRPIYLQAILQSASRWPIFVAVGKYYIKRHIFWKNNLIMSCLHASFQYQIQYFVDERPLSISYLSQKMLVRMRMLKIHTRTNHLTMKLFWK